MNNLKRVLGLGLTGAMLAGLLTVGASAADFTDADKIQHDEAVNVLVALKVIDGKPDGSFDPEGNVTRAEMAKMIAVAMNGGSDANTGTKLTPSFTDISGHWAESYIEYCADLGIISGRGDGTFDPGANVTGLEATKMVLSALGFEATAYKLTGPSWAVRTDEVARTQTGLTQANGVVFSSPDARLYDELEGVILATPATREVAAQLIWNGLQNHTRIVAPDRNTNSGEVTWSYQVGSNTLLKERYDANTMTGTFEGNHDTGHAANAGEIKVGRYDFPYDLDIDEIGEEFKVVWRDSKDGKTGPDKRDTIYGVFNTGKTEVYRITKNDLQDAKGDAATKIKFGDVKYDAASTIDVVTNYNSDIGTQSIAASAFSASPYKLQSEDTIKFVVQDNANDPDDGKIYKAYVTEYNITRVTSVSSSKVALQGVGSIDIEGNDIYDDIAVDDVVVYTQFYKNDKDDAVFTVTKAESVEGKMTGFKFDSGEYKNIVVDGTTIKVETPAASLPANITNDYVSQLTDTVLTSIRNGQASIGDTIRVYKIGNMVGCVQLVDGEGGKYAVVTEVNDGEVGSVMKPLRVSVVMPDGTEELLTVHKDSTKDGSAKIKDEASAGAQQGLFDMAKGGSGSNNEGNLIEYSSISNGSIKIKRIASSVTDATIAGSGALTAGLLWDEDARILQYTAGKTAVAAADSVMFVGVDKTRPADGDADDWYTYDMRAMGDIPYDANNSSAVTVQYFLNDKGLVDAACVVMTSRPGSNATDTLYGIVTGYTGTRQNTAGDDLWIYTVAVGRDEDVTVAVDTQGEAIPNGTLVMFNERADGEYDLGSEIVAIVGAADGTAGTANNTVANSSSCASGVETNTGFILAAVREYNADKGVISYYTGTTFNGTIFEGNSGTQIGSRSVDKDVALFYVNADDNKQGADTGVTLYDTSTGYANAVLHYNDKGVVDAIIVETSGKANLAKAPGNSTTPGQATETFGTGAYTMGSATQTGHGLTVTATPSKTVVAGSEAVTYTVRVDGTADASATGKTITITLTGLTGATTLAPTTGTNCTASGLVITVTANSAATSGTFTVSGTGVTASVTPSIAIQS